MAKSVLMVGWHPEAVDYAKWPGLTPERLEAGLAAEEAALRELGLEAETMFIRDAGTAPAALAERLRAAPVDVVLIGAGVRRDDAHMLLFEALVNAVHMAAPGTRLAFNSGPGDTADAVRRWI